MKALVVLLLVVMVSGVGSAQKNNATVPKKDIGSLRMATTTSPRNGVRNKSLNSNAVAAALKNRSTSSNASNLARIEHSSYAHQRTIRTTTNLPKTSLPNLNNGNSGSKSGKSSGKRIPQTHTVSHTKTH